MANVFVFGIMYLRFWIAKDLGQNNMSAKQVSIIYKKNMFIPDI